MMNSYLKTVSIAVCVLFSAGNANAGLFDADVNLNAKVDINNRDLDVIIAAYDRFPDHVIKVIGRAEIAGENLIEKAGEEINRNLSYASCLADGVAINFEASLTRLVSQLPFTDGVAECGAYTVRENLSPNPYELFEYELCRVREVYEKEDFEGGEIVTKLGNTDSAIQIASCWIERSPELPDPRKRVLTEKKSKYQPIFIAWDFADRDCVGMEKCAISSVNNVIAKMEAYPDRLPLKSVIINQSSKLLPKQCKAFFKFFCSSTSNEEWEEKMRAAARGFSLLKMEYEKTGIDQMINLSEQAENLIESAKTSYDSSLTSPLIDASRSKFLNDMNVAKKKIDRLSINDRYFDPALGKFPSLENYRLDSIAIYEDAKINFQNDLYRVTRTRRDKLNYLGPFGPDYYRISCRFRDGQLQNYELVTSPNCPAASGAVKTELRKNLLDPLE